MVIMNAGTSIITAKSPYAAHTSVTLPQVSEAFGTWAFKSGIRKAYTLVSDFAPGHDAEGGFHVRSRRPAARSSALCAFRWQTPTSPPSSSAPRT
jgi:branched-chain amino acid transport system substrate-binding protein